MRHKVGACIARRRGVSLLPCPHRARCPSSNRDSSRSNLKLAIGYIRVVRRRPRLHPALDSPDGQSSRKHRATIHEAIPRLRSESATSTILHYQQLRMSHRLTKLRPPCPIPSPLIAQMSRRSSCAAATERILSRRFPTPQSGQSPPVYRWATASTSFRSCE